MKPTFLKHCHSLGTIIPPLLLMYLPLTRAYKNTTTKWAEKIADYITFIHNRKEAERKYRGSVVDHVSVDEIMLLLVKGEEISFYPHCTA